MSEDDSVKHEGKWTRADLPSVIKSHAYAGKYFSRLQELEEYMDAMLDHLNEHYPKPEHRLLSSAAECVLGAEDRVRSVKAERDKWKARADQLRDERDDAVQSCIAVGRERDEAVARADHAEKGAWRVRYQHAVAELLDAGRARDEWKARAERAESERDHGLMEISEYREKLAAAYARAEKAEHERDEWHQRAENAEWGMGHPDRRWSDEDLEAEVRRRTQCLRENLHGVTRSRDEWERRFHDLNHDLIDSEMQPAPAVSRADQLRDERDDAVQSCMAVGRERDEWKARAEAAEARTVITREDVTQAVRRGHNMLNAEVGVVNEMCDLLGIETEPTVDLIEEKAIELHRVAYGGRIGFGHATLNAQEMFRSLARHVLGGENAH